MSNGNPWKYVEVDIAGLEDNPYLNPRKAAAQPAVDTSEPTGTIFPTVITNAADFLLLENITCVDSNNNPFEQYDTLQVRKDIFREANGGQVNLIPYNANVRCQQNGLFLPSFALSCAIVAQLYQAAVKKESNGTYKTLNSDAKKVLDQYKDKGNGTGWHAQSTVINWGTQEIIHYPRDGDFPNNGGTHNINQSQARKTFKFNKAGFGSTTLADALTKPEFKKYVQNLTGLNDPSVLVRLGEYFGKPAKVWVSSSNETRAAWFGCGSNDLDLGGSDDLDYGYAARGVRGI